MFRPSRRGFEPSPKLIRFFIQLNESGHKANKPSHSDTHHGLRQTVARMGPWVLTITQRHNRAYEARHFCTTAKIANMANSHGHENSDTDDPFFRFDYRPEQHPASCADERCSQPF